MSSLAWVPNKPILAIGGYDEHIHFWRFTDKKEKEKPGQSIGPVGNAVLSLAVSPDGKTIWGTRTDRSAAKEFRPFVAEVPNGNPLFIAVERPNNAPQFLGLSPRGDRLAMTCGEDNRLAFQEVSGTKGTKLKYFGVAEPPPTEVNWHDKGALIAWGREGRRDRVFSFLNLDWAEDPKTGFQTAAEKRLAGRLAMRFEAWGV